MTHDHAKPFDSTCLHCLLDFTIQAWAERHAPRRADGSICLNASGVIENLAAVMGELVYHTRDELTRRQFERFAHAAVERAFHAESVGNVIVVSFDRGCAA